MTATYKFLIDECLTPQLAVIARQLGHHESTCVRDRGWSGLKDYELIKLVMAEDFTLVTRNSVDFRGNGPGQLGGLHAEETVHAGLVCLNYEGSLHLALQVKLFKQVLLDLSTMPDLVNKAYEVHHCLDGSTESIIYEIP
jgi:hypothetical protein